MNGIKIVQHYIPRFKKDPESRSRKWILRRVIIDYFISITVHIASNSITINDIIDSIEYQSIHKKVSMRIKILNIWYRLSIPIPLHSISSQYCIESIIWYFTSKSNTHLISVILSNIFSSRYQRDIFIPFDIFTFDLRIDTRFIDSQVLITSESIIINSHCLYYYVCNIWLYIFLNKAIILYDIFYIIMHNKWKFTKKCVTQIIQTIMMNDVLNKR